MRRCHATIDVIADVVVVFVVVVIVVVVAVIVVVVNVLDIIANTEMAAAASAAVAKRSTRDLKWKPINSLPLDQVTSHQSRDYFSTRPLRHQLTRKKNSETGFWAAEKNSFNWKLKRT